MAERSGTCKRGKLKREEKTEGKKKKKTQERENRIVKNRATGPRGFQIGTKMSLVA